MIQWIIFQMNQFTKMEQISQCHIRETFEENNVYFAFDATWKSTLKKY